MSLADDQFSSEDYIKSAEEAVLLAASEQKPGDIPELSESALKPEIRVPDHVHAAICELLQKRDSIAQEVKRLETICDGLIRDVAEREGCPLEQYSYNLQNGTLEKN